MEVDLVLGLVEISSKRSSMDPYRLELYRGRNVCSRATLQSTKRRARIIY